MLPCRMRQGSFADDTAIASMHVHLFACFHRSIERFPRMELYENGNPR